MKRCLTNSVLLLACALASASAVSGQTDASEVGLDELDEPIRNALLSHAELKQYLDANPALRFSVIAQDDVLGSRRVAILRDGREIGYAMVGEGRVRAGNLEGKPLDHDVLVVSVTPSTSARTPTATTGAQADRATRVTEAAPDPAEEEYGRILSARFDGDPLSGAGAPSLVEMTRGAPLMWTAILFILLLTVRTDSWASIRNVDGLVLAGTCALLMARFTSQDPAAGLAGLSPRWWIFLLLTLAAGYWIARGLLLTRAHAVAGHACNVSAGAMVVMLIFSLAVAATAISKQPLTGGTLDGVIGGRYLAATGKLPYGQLPGADNRSPLVYVLHGAAQKLRPVYVEAGGNRVPPDWNMRETWLRRDWAQSGDLTAARLVNGCLAALAVAGLVLAGARLHSLPAGLTLAVIFSIFPGAIECLGRTDVLLTAALLSWTVAFATVRGLGGLLATICLVFAGLSWPWAWLGLPVLLGFFLRRGLDGLGAVVGTLGGAAAIVAGLAWLTKPMLPRSDGALASAGVVPKFNASSSGDQVIIEPAQAQAQASDWTVGIKRALWRPLLDDLRVSDSDLNPVVQGASADEVKFADTAAADPAAREKMQRAYERLVSSSEPATRVRTAVRTTLEATWAVPPAPDSPVQGAWELWAGGQQPRTGTLAGTGVSEVPPCGRWVTYRRIAKALLTILAIILALVLLVGRGRDLHQLLGALVAVCAGGLIVDQPGAVTNWVLLLPLILPLLASWCEREPEFQPAANPAYDPLLKLGPRPRISVEK